MSEQSVKVLVVDDQAPFRRVAATVVAVTPGFEVVGEADTGEQAVEIAAELQPELVLMDINLPGINGLEATGRLKSVVPSAVVILLSTYRADDLPDGALDTGAVAYVHKEDFEPSVIVEAWAHHAASA